MAKPEAMRIGGKDVSRLVAALMAEVADRRGVLLSEVGDVAIPNPTPSTVRIAGFTVSLEAGAAIAAEADARGLHPKKLIEAIVVEHVEALGRRGRRRAPRRS